MADLPIPQWLRDRSNIQRRVLRWNRTVEPDGMVRWRLPLGLSQLVTRTMPGKLIPAWFVRLPAEERAAFLDAFIRGDGCVRGDRCVIGQRSEANINALQSIIASLGQASGKYVEHRTDGDMHFASVRQVAFRGLRAANGGPPVGVGAQQYDGMVWCPTTPTGTWVARRNGTVFVTGNSHYGACCDTHPPRGLLFGKYTRKVWVPQHARGDVDTGVVEQTFVTAGSDR